MRNKKVAAYSYLFQEMYFSKDIFLIPYYIAKETGRKLEYYYNQNLGNTDIPNRHRGARLRKSKIGNEFLSMLFNILLVFWRIDILFINGSSLKHMVVVWLYKHLNNKGKIIIFGDMERPLAEEFNRNGLIYSGGLKGKIKRYFVNFFFNNTTYIVANTGAYSLMDELCKRNKWKGLLHFYPCLDDELFERYCLKRKTFEEKENIMICVGRIGNKQKNTDMLLKALENVDLKDWKIYMIGPITTSFNLKDNSDYQDVIDRFFEKNPQYKNKLIFTGMIYDMKEVFEYYIRAKVLLATSRHEGFANVYSQAAALGCYIVSTDVGGADIASNHWKYGTCIGQEDADGLARTLDNLVNGRIPIDEKCSFSKEEMSYSYRINSILIPKMNICP